MIAVREIEPRAVLDARPERMRPGLPDRAPAHVRDLEPLARRQRHVLVAKALRRARAARRGTASALPRSPRTASAGRGRCRGTAGRAGTPARRRAVRSRRGSPCSRASRSGPAARRATAPRITSGSSVTTIDALGRDVHERLRHRAQVAHSVVDDGDVGHQGSGQVRDQTSGTESRWHGAASIPVAVPDA